MNDIVTLDAEPTTSTALTIIRSALPTIIGADTNDILGKLAAKVRAFEPDPSTKKGQDAIRSLAAEIASSKMDLIRLGKSLTEGWRSQTAAVNAECKVIEERMDALKTQVRQPLTDFENAEKARTKANDDAIAALEALVDGLADLTADQIKERFQQAGVIAEFPWSVEFTVKAERTQNGVIAQLEVAHARAKAREAEAAAEVGRLAEEAEIQRLAAVEAQRVREEQIAHEAAEAARLAAEALAARQAEAAAKAAQDALDAAEARAQAERDAAAQREREAEAKAAHDREIARQVAERAETARVAAHHAAIVIMRKLATPLAPPDPVPVIDAKLEQLQDVYERDWEEFSSDAEITNAGASTALTAARAESIRLATERAEKDLADALERERIAADRAEITRKAEIAKVEREKLAAIEAATLAEQRRAAAVKAEEDRQTEARAKNREHKAKINGAVLDGMMDAVSTVHAGSAGEAAQIAKAIITAIAKGQVPHTTISY